MSVSRGGSEKMEIEDGLQVLEVALSIEGNADAGRTTEAVTAHEPREVWAIGFGDPHGHQDRNEGEGEFSISRDESTLNRPEISTQIANGASGHAYNEIVWQFGYTEDFHDTATSRDGFNRHVYMDSFPVPIIWQEDETWHFDGFLSSTGGAGSFMEQEFRLYFTASDRQVVPFQSRVID